MIYYTAIRVSTNFEWSFCKFGKTSRGDLAKVPGLKLKNYLKFKYLTAIKSKQIPIKK